MSSKRINSHTRAREVKTNHFNNMSHTNNNTNNNDDDGINIDEDEIDDWLDSEEEGINNEEEEDKEERKQQKTNLKDENFDMMATTMTIITKTTEEGEEVRESAAAVAVASAAQKEKEAEERRVQERREIEEAEERRVYEEQQQHAIAAERANKQEEERKKKNQKEVEEKLRLEAEESAKKQAAVKERAKQEPPELFSTESEQKEEERAQSHDDAERKTKAIHDDDYNNNNNNNNNDNSSNNNNNNNNKEFDELAQSSTIIGGLFGSFKVLRNVASKTVNAVKSHELTRQVTNDIRELSKHIAGEDVVKSKASEQTNENNELVEQQRVVARQSDRDEIDALAIAEKFASKTWHAIGGITNKSKQLVTEVEGSIKTSGLSATATKFGQSALFGIERALSKATKVITAGIEGDDVDNEPYDRLAKILSEHKVFDFLDAIDMNTKDAEESFKALDFEASNFMLQICHNILSPPAESNSEIGSPTKINTNEDFHELDVNYFDTDSINTWKIHAKKVLERAHEIFVRLTEESAKPLEYYENPLAKALAMIKLAEDELENLRGIVTVVLAQFTVVGCQKLELVSIALMKNENSRFLETWGTTVESRASYVQNQIASVIEEMRTFLNLVMTEVDRFKNVFVANSVVSADIPTVHDVVITFGTDVERDLFQCLDIFEDAKGMLIPAIVCSCL